MVATAPGFGGQLLGVRSLQNSKITVEIWNRRSDWKERRNLVRPERFELPTYCSGGCSNQPWSTRNQAVTVALEWPYTALLALAEHILHTANVEIAVASSNEDFSRTTQGHSKEAQTQQGNIQDEQT
jgi:hypothetical protein